jgi:rubrerythrin
MKRWRCMICGYIHDGPQPPAVCPICGALAAMFESLNVDNGPDDPQRW